MNWEALILLCIVVFLAAMRACFAAAPREGFLGQQPYAGIGEPVGLYNWVFR